MCSRFPSVEILVNVNQLISVNFCLFKSIGTLFHLGGGFIYFLCSPVGGEMIQFD